MILTTEQAATLLNRKPQTLRRWSCLNDGPISPIRINGRLAWREADIQKLMKGEHATNEKKPKPVIEGQKRRGRPTKAEAARKHLSHPELAPFYALVKLMQKLKDGIEKDHLAKAFDESPYAKTIRKVVLHMEALGEL